MGDVDFRRYAARLHVGKKVSDEEFDSVYGGRARTVSFRHWSPVGVACRAARLLTETGATRILDVGARETTTGGPPPNGSPVRT